MQSGRPQNTHGKGVAGRAAGAGRREVATRSPGHAEFLDRETERSPARCAVGSLTVSSHTT
ncbi:hypothetical protein E2C01_082121 [Portunus trituberculatus]|uniref:Uncharacterized protein n=1 Tax=Portunus trituberculatus TaxID=210409 RepID=A0A5B7J427_PORTR|nr:hypothetical protein [Portunus trituberculatus]